MQRVFRIEETNELLYQKQLVEREIQFILENRSRFIVAKPKETVKTSVVAEGSDEDLVQPRPVHEDDVCPICQDALKSQDSLIHCNLSCGNNIHQKCMQILIKHQKSIGNKIMKCPVKNFINLVVSK